MFYSESLLSKKGPLARVWLAANLERKLTKSQFLQTSIPKSISTITDQPLALRLSGQLLLGVVRIYSRKARYLLEDCNDALMKIKMAFRPGNVDMAPTTVAKEGLVLQDTITELDLVGPQPDFLLSQLAIPEISSTNLSKAADITLLSPPEIGRDMEEEDPLADIPIDEDLDMAIREGTEVELGRDEEQHLSAQFFSDPPLEGGQDQGQDQSMAMDWMPPDHGDAIFSDRISKPISPVHSVGHLSPNPSLVPPELSDLRMLTPPAEEEEPFRARARLTKKRKVIVDERVEMNKKKLSGKADDTDASLLKSTKYLPRDSDLLALQLDSQSGAMARNAFCPPHINAHLAALLDPERMREQFLKRKVEEVEELEEPARQSPVGEAPMDLPAMEDEPLPPPDYGPVDQPAYDVAVEEFSYPELEVPRVQSSPAPSAIVQSTQDTAAMLRSAIGGGKKGVSFSQVSSGANRNDAVKLFFEVLVLATKDAVRVCQPVNFGEISIQAKEKLYETAQV